MSVLANTNLSDVQSVKKYPVLISTFENGAEQRRGKSQNPVIGFDVTTRDLTAAEAAALDSFYDSVGGELTAFSWTHPVTGTAYTVRFDGEIKAAATAAKNGRQGFTYRLKVVY